MVTPPDPDETRHRLLEGVLLRLARRPDASAFVLRGGLLMRHWFRPVRRPADDVDLIATFPFNVEETARRFLPVLADATVADGATFDPGRTRVSGIRLNTDSPAVRVFATGTFGGEEIDFNVDVTFGPAPRPAAAISDIPTACGEVARLWACRPEAVVGQKVQALRFRGALDWRPKDLNDLRLLLRLPLDRGDLRLAVTAYLADLGGTLADARTLFGPESWWGTKFSAARWSDFVRASPGRDMPRSLEDVVAEVAGRLLPVLEGAP